MSFLSDLFSSPAQAPPPPNYAPILASLNTQAQTGNALAQQQMQWAQQQYAQNQGQIQPILQNFEQAQNDALTASEQDRARYQSVYQPLEDRQIQDANTYDSADNMQRMRGRAEAGVAQNFEAQRANTTQDLESYGINPAATRYAALDTGVRTQQAAAQAAAGNQSDLATEATARGLRQNMIQVGQTMPSQIAAESQTATGAGGAGVGGALNLTASGANTMGNPTQWYGGGSAALNSQGALTNTGYQNQMEQFKANQTASSGLGTLLGGAMGLGMNAFGSSGMFGSKGAFGGAFGGGGGGSTPTAATGGAIPDSPSSSPNRVPESAQMPGEPASDGVNARLTPGEFVFPKKAVDHYGTDKLSKMVEKALGTKAQPRPQMKQAINAPVTFRSAG
jgi:hypothetical protein